jgi:hypothetical protein
VVSGWGVADGLRVRATPGARGVTVGPGTAVDAAGNEIVLGPDGTTLDTTGPGGDLLLTISSREVAGTASAPELRLVPADGFDDDGAQVVLARLTLTADGAVAEGGLTAGPRRAAGGPAGGELSVGGPLRSGDITANTITAHTLSVSGIADAFQYRTDGQSWLRGQVYTGEFFGHWDGVATLALLGSRIWDGGDGWLQVQSGGGRTFLRGEVTVQGRLHKPGGGFRIDHPLDPEQKYLSHSFVESPDMVDLYTGVAVTDEDGVARVVLPGYFEALNRDHRFQLTTIGQLALATVQEEVRDNAFTIRTDRPGVTVCWQVTGVRQDPWAEVNRIRAEEDKPAPERGSLLHPELYDRPGARAFRPAAPEAAPAAADPPADELGGGSE